MSDKITLRNIDDMPNAEIGQLSPEQQQALNDRIGNGWRHDASIRMIWADASSELAQHGAVLAMIVNTKTMELDALTVDLDGTITPWKEGFE